MKYGDLNRFRLQGGSYLRLGHNSGFVFLPMSIDELG
jgi:hypothetical protein